MNIGGILFSMFLGVLGYLLYIVSIVGGVYFSGPVLAPAIVGTVPIFMVILGNLAQNTLVWRRLIVPLFLTLSGLALINLNLLYSSSTDVEGNFFYGVLFCISGVICWLAFSLLNQRFSERNPFLNTGTHTGLMMMGAGLTVLLFAPIGMYWGLVDPSPPRVNADNLSWFIMWALIFALMSSVGGAWAWNYATKKLPMILMGQLIAVETLFATFFGLMASQQFPTWFELSGTVLVVLGVVTTVRAVMNSQAAGEKHSP